MEQIDRNIYSFKRCKGGVHLMAKSLFNLYLDDNIKQRAMAKLTRLNGETTKGQLASFIRVKINEFVQTPDEEVDKKLLLNVLEELQECNRKGRISRL